MALPGDRRSVLQPRSRVNAAVQRLIAASERAESVTLSPQEIGTLLTFIEAAKRLAAGEPQALEVRALHGEIASLQYHVRQATEAWEASERALWRKDLEAL